jgi:hypothetical protein
MQLTVIPSGPNGGQEVTLTLRVEPDHKCSICLQHSPRWFDDPATETAMDPSLSAIGGPDCCGDCLNALLELGLIEVTAIDTEAF